LRELRESRELIKCGMVLSNVRQSLKESFILPLLCSWTTSTVL